MVDAGQRGVFDPKGSFIEDTVAGDRIPMDRRGGIYKIKLWAKQFSPTDTKSTNNNHDFHGRG